MKKIILIALIAMCAGTSNAQEPKNATHKQLRAEQEAAFDIPACGPDGSGGITVTGRISDFEQSIDRRGNLYIPINVMDTDISEQQQISLPRGSSSASVDILPNFNSNRHSLSGVLLPLCKAHLFQGRSF